MGRVNYVYSHTYQGIVGRLDKKFFYKNFIVAGICTISAIVVGVFIVGGDTDVICDSFKSQTLSMLLQ